MNTTTLKRLGQGVECQVYEVNSKIVCKVFVERFGEKRPQPKQAAFAYRMQKIAYRAKLAPRPLALENNQYYSERAESFDSIGYNGNWYNVKDTREFQEFIKQLENIFGGSFSDSHSGNIARLPDGRMCLIDFGICGFTYSKIGELLAGRLAIDI